VERLVIDVERARYARGSAASTGRPAAEVAADVELCSEALRVGASKKHRRLAVWLPASLVKNSAWRSVLPSGAAGEPAVVEAGVDRAT
jgi:hypothetical protein